MLQDLRYALRLLGKDFGFSAVAVLTLALGIGANTAIFTVVNAVLLRPLPYPQSKRLVLLYARDAKRPTGQGSFSMIRLNQLRSQSRSFSNVAGFCSDTFNLTGVDQPEQLTAARVSSNFLQTVSVHPALGRDFLPEEDREGAKPVVLLNVAGFYDTMLEFLQVCEREGMLRGNLKCLLVAKTVDEALKLCNVA